MGWLQAYVGPMEKDSFRCIDGPFYEKRRQVEVGMPRNPHGVRLFFLSFSYYIILSKKLLLDFFGYLETKLSSLIFYLSFYHFWKMNDVISFPPWNCKKDEVCLVCPEKNQDLDEDYRVLNL